MEWLLEWVVMASLMLVLLGCGLLYHVFRTWWTGCTCGCCYQWQTRVEELEAEIAAMKEEEYLAGMLQPSPYGCGCGEHAVSRDMREQLATYDTVITTTRKGGA